jgi:hypothetical protein
MEAIPFTEQIGATYRGLPVFRVNVPRPPYSNKGYCVMHKGLYVLEEGEGMLTAVACTHFGEGFIRIFDTRLNDNLTIPAYSPLLYSTPQTMCLWMLGAGFNNGLVVEAVGAREDIPVFLSLSWSKFYGET